ncbi:MAG: cellulose biosynthesis protein BcsS [Alphaproteobacteria bacterium]|nr:MAG: cellulose biosynthesis protein BcsS [Alphaproteobacteria bacterium]
MRRVVVCTVAAFTAAMVWCGLARASEPERETEAAAHLLFFSGADVWRNGAFMHGGLLYAYQGLNQDGPVFKLLLNGGLYRFQSGGSEISGRQVMGAALPGWRWTAPGVDLTVFAGLDVQDHRYVPDDPGNRLRGTHLGARGGFDVWYEPLQNGMLTGSASLSTVGKSYWTRAAGGWRLFDALWLGPEFLACGDDTYRQLRFGAHVTSLRVLGYEWSAGAGWVTDSDKRDGLYGRVGVLVRR